MLDKRHVLEALRDLFRQRLAEFKDIHDKAQAGATHVENRAEHAKDTRATEASYLARGLAQRVAELEQSARLLESLTLREFSPDDPIEVTALIGLEDDNGDVSTFFLVPAGGGEKITVGGETIRTITPTSPLGCALVSRSVGDEFAFELPSGRQDSAIRWVR